MTAGLTREDSIALGTSGAADVWGAFYDMSQIPRMSKREAAVLDYIKQIADKHGLTHKCDAFGNLAVQRPGSAKGAKSAPVIVQAHVDMVCEKNDDVQHDFTVDPVRFRRDGEWLKARGTTLGADNGLGAAAGAARFDVHLIRLARATTQALEPRTGLCCQCTRHAERECSASASRRIAVMWRPDITWRLCCAALVLMQQPHDADLPPLELLFTTVRPWPRESSQ